MRWRDAIGGHHRWQRPVTLQPSAALSGFRLSPFLPPPACELPPRSLAKARLSPSIVALRVRRKKHKSPPTSSPNTASLNTEFELRLPVFASNRRSTKQPQPDSNPNHAQREVKFSFVMRIHVVCAGLNVIPSTALPSQTSLIVSDTIRVFNVDPSSLAAEPLAWRIRNK